VPFVLHARDGSAQNINHGEELRKKELAVQRCAGGEWWGIYFMSNFM